MRAQAAHRLRRSVADRRTSAATTLRSAGMPALDTPLCMTAPPPAFHSPLTPFPGPPQRTCIAQHTQHAQHSKRRASTVARPVHDELATAAVARLLCQRHAAHACHACMRAPRHRCRDQGSRLSTSSMSASPPDRLVSIVPPYPAQWPQRHEGKYYIPPNPLFHPPTHLVRLDQSAFTPRLWCVGRCAVPTATWEDRMLPRSRRGSAPGRSPEACRR